MQKNKIDLSIVIINFNTSELTLQCVESVLASQTENDIWEILVVDNNSDIHDWEKLSLGLKQKTFKNHTIDLMRNDKNVGFSAGNNKGITKARGAYVLLLNSDTEVQNSAIQQSLALLQSDKTIGAVTCKLVLPSGQVDPACHRGFPTPWASITYFLGFEKIFPHTHLFSQYHLGDRDLETIHEIDSPSGAFFLIKKEVIETVGLLDESYFMYGEDIDYAYRIKEKGWRILYTPKATVLHKKKQSGRNNKDENVRKITTKSFYETMKLFYMKHYMEKYPSLVTWLIIAVLNLRMKVVDSLGK